MAIDEPVEGELQLLIVFVRAFGNLPPNAEDQVLPIFGKSANPGIEFE